MVQQRLWLVFPFHEKVVLNPINPITDGCAAAIDYYHPLPWAVFITGMETVASSCHNPTQLNLKKNLSENGEDF